MNRARARSARSPLGAGPSVATCRLGAPRQEKTSAKSIHFVAWVRRCLGASWGICAACPDPEGGGEGEREGPERSQRGVGSVRMSASRSSELLIGITAAFSRSAMRLERLDPSGSRILASVRAALAQRMCSMKAVAPSTASGVNRGEGSPPLGASRALSPAPALPLRQALTLASHPSRGRSADVAIGVCCDRVQLPEDEVLFVLASACA